jgi:predicted dithiol-disulfide oxidoreductase (DUF899 family)
MICFSRAPIDRLAAYKERMGWEFRYVSTYDSDFPWDFGLDEPLNYRKDEYPASQPAR